MNTTVQCLNCKASKAVNKTELQNLGTSWHPTFGIKCPRCGFDIVINDFGKMSIVDNSVSASDGRFKNEKDGYQRAIDGEIREYWSQLYFRDHFRDFGFSGIEGPFDAGPDFHGIYKGKRVFIEVERNWQIYLKHGHDKDLRWKGCMLVVLAPDKPPNSLKRHLPKRIMHIDLKKFVPWWQKQCSEYIKQNKDKWARKAQQQRLTYIVNLVADEFRKRFAVNCSDKERDMAVCPECGTCAYFDEYDIDFQKTALLFLAVYKHDIESKTFKLTDIEPSEIDEFYYATL